MTELSKTLKKYLLQLIIIGLIYLGVSIFCFWIIAKSFPQVSIIYLPIICLGFVIGYLVALKYPAGGNVNYYLSKHTLTADERKLDQLIIKCRSKTIMTLCFLSISIFLTIYGLRNFNSEANLSLNKLGFTAFFSIFAMAIFGISVKYITAWWNIKMKPQ